MSTDETTFSSESSAEPKTSKNVDPLETAQWTRYLPEAFGIQEAVRKSSYRWCVRESGMWGIGTATAMSLRREHQEQVIEAMMKYNQFGHASDMPAETPLEEHPFWEKTDANSTANKHESEFRGMIKERKEWQKKEDKSFEEIFNEKR